MRIIWLLPLQCALKAGCNLLTQISGILDGANKFWGIRLIRQIRQCKIYLATLRTGGRQKKKNMILLFPKIWEWNLGQMGGGSSHSHTIMLNIWPNFDEPQKN